MKYQFLKVAFAEKSNRATDVAKKIEQTKYAKEIADYLNLQFTEDFVEQMEDLHNWVDVIEKLESILDTHSIKLSSVDNIILDNHENTADEYIVSAVLNFLSLLLKSAKDKRFFLSFHVAKRLMRSTNIKISKLATELLFYVCIPASSISNTLNDDWVDSIEVPDIIAQDAFLLFESLSFLSKDFGITDYLHGHEPSFLDCHGENLTLNFPPRNIGDPIVEVKMKLHPFGDTQSLLTELQTLKEKNGLSGDEVWVLFNVQRAIWGLHSSMEYRLDVTDLRLKAFFLLVHSRLSSPAFQEFLKNSSPFIKDLIELSDLSSEAMSELNLTAPIPLVYVVLENVLGLLENKLRRRSSIILHSGITELLGLSRMGGDGSINNSQEDQWTAIVIAACAAGAPLFSDPKLTASVNEIQATKTPVALISTDVEKPEVVGQINLLGRFVRTGLELYALSLTTREQVNVVSDIPIVGTVVGLVQQGVPHLSTILKKYEVGKGAVLTAKELQLLLVMAKALYCLELTIDRSGYITAFRETEGLAVTLSIVEMFAELSGPTNEPLGSLQLSVATKSVLESSLSVLFLSVQKSRQSIITHGLANDTAIRAMYQGFFGDLCTSVFTSAYKQNELIWSQLLCILKEVIDLDPAYISHFLSTPYCSIILCYNNSDRLQKVAIPQESTDLENVIIALARLAVVINVSTDGKAFLRHCKIFHFLLETVVSSCSILPQSPGIVNDRLGKFGRLLAQTMLECDSLRAPLTQLIRSKLVEYCSSSSILSSSNLVEATTGGDSRRSRILMDQSELDSQRMQNLQKLSNMCCIVENMFSENRRHYGEILRELLSGPVLEALVKSFASSLPPPRQLLSQVSLRHANTSPPHFGNHASAKAISGLLKVAATSLPQTMMPILYREVDETLQLISATKLALKAASPQTVGGAEKDRSGMKRQEDSLPPPTGRGKRSRGNSLGNQTGANVQVLGALDHLPDRCILDPACVVALESKNGEWELQSCRFLSAVLNLEWLAIIMSHTLRSLQRYPTSTAITSGRETLRRLFAFYRFSMLEVCRFGATRWTEKPFEECRVKKGYNETFCNCDSSEDPVPIPRVAREFKLRIAGSGGALVREGIEIEGSRVVFIAEVGTELTADERRLNAAGLVRYHTAHGWISEYRRDHQRSPIVELLEISELPSLEVDPVEESLTMEEKQKKREQEREGVTELLTLQEAGSVVMARSHTALKQVAVYLARATNTNESVNSAMNPSSSSHVLSKALSKIMRGFFANTMEYLPDSALTSDILSLPNVSGTTAYGNLDLSSSWSAAGKGKELTTPSKVTMKRSTGILGSNNSLPANEGSASKGQQTDEDDAFLQEVQRFVGIKPICLFYGAVVKNLVLPLLEDKNGNLNVLLLRNFSNHGVVEAIMEATVLILSTLKDSIDAANGSEQKQIDMKPQLNAAGRCALNAVPSLIALLRRMINREIFTKSVLVNSTNFLVDEAGPYQTHDMIYQLLTPVISRVIPLFQSNALTAFPPDIQCEWLGLVGDLVHSLVTPMPAPREIPNRHNDRAGINPFNYNMSRSGRGSNAASPSTAAASRAVAVARAEPFTPDEGIIDALGDMGFSRVEVRAGMEAIGSNNLGRLTEYLISHGVAEATTPAPAPSTQASSVPPLPPVPGDSAPASLPLPVQVESTGTAAQTEELQAEGEGEEEEDTEDLDLLAALQMSLAIQDPPSEQGPSSAGDTIAVATENTSTNTATVTNPGSEGTEVPDDPHYAALRPLLLDMMNASLRNTAEGGATPDELPNLVAELDSSNQGNNLADLVFPERSTGETPSFGLRERLRRSRELVLSHLPSPPHPGPGPGADSGVTSAVFHNTDSALNSYEPLNLGPSSAGQYMPASRGPSKRENDRSTPKSEPKDIYSEFHIQCHHLAVFSDCIGKTCLTNVMNICSRYEDILKWEKTGLYFFIPHLVDFTIQLNQEAKFSSSLSHILATLLQDLADADSGRFRLNPFGHLLFFTLYLREHVNHKKVETAKITLVGIFHLVIGHIKELLSQFESSTSTSWPNWLSPAVVLLHEIVSLPNSPLTEEELKKLRDAGKKSSGTEEKEGKALGGESKQTSDRSSDLKKRDESVGLSSMAILSGVHLLSEEEWLDAYEVTNKLFELSATDKPLTADTSQGLLMLLQALLLRQDLASRFVESGGLKSVLRMKYRVEEEHNLMKSSLTTFSALTVIVQRCLETSVELQQDISTEIKKLFKGLPENSHSVKYDKFMQVLGKWVVRCPSDFWQCCSNYVKFVKVARETEKAGQEEGAKESAEKKLEIEVKLIDKSSSNASVSDSKMPLVVGFTAGDSHGDPDERSYKTLKTVLQFIISSARNKYADTLGKGNKFAHNSVSALDALTDSILSLKRAPILLTSILKSDNDGLKIKSGDNFISFLLHKFLANNIELPSDKPPAMDTLESTAERQLELNSTSRLLVVLCSFRGPSRLLTLQAVLKMLRHHCVSPHAKTSSTSVGESESTVLHLSEGTKTAEESKRMLLVSRLSSLVAILLQASAGQRRNELMRGQQGISLEAVQYVVVYGNVLKILSMALNSVPFYGKHSAGAIKSILELVELITNPKVQLNLDKLQQASSSNSSTNQDRGSTQDECIDVSRFNEGVLPAHHLLENAGVLHQISEELQESEEDLMEEDDEEEDDEDEDDDDFDDEEEDDDDDEDDDEYMGPGARQHWGDAEEETHLTDDSYVNVDQVIPTMTSERPAMNQSIWDSMDMMEISGAALPGLPQHTFSTPPMETGVSEFQSIFHNMLQETRVEDLTGENSINLIADMIQRVREGTSQPAQEQHPWRNNTTVTQSSTSELLPRGVDEALEVRPSVPFHPLLGLSFRMPPAGALRVSAGAGPPSFNGQTPTAGVPSMFATRFPPLMRNVIQPVTTGPNRTVIHFSTNGNSGNRVLPVFNSTEEELAHLNLRTLEREGDMLGGGGSRGTGGVEQIMRRSRAEPGVAQGASEGARDIIDLMQQQLQQNLIEGLDVTSPEEPADEGSQSSFSASASRGVPASADTDGGFSYSTQSMQAVQDPNPRGNRSDSRAQHSIPPLIEIDSPDHEGNEELSVITLPQEDNTQATEAANQDTAEHHNASITHSQDNQTVIPHRSPTTLRDMRSTSPVAPTSSNVSVSGATSVMGEDDQSVLEDVSVMPVMEEASVPLPTVAEHEPLEPLNEPVADETQGEEPMAEVETAQELLSVMEVGPEEPSSTESGSGGLACPPGYDSDVFYSLPVEMQQEIVEQHGETTEQMRELAEAAGFDLETLASLPDNIRQEVLEQARRTQAQENGGTGGDAAMAAAMDAPGGSGQEMDNASFLASLTLELRSEVLLTADPDFLATLPAELVAEAQVLRDRAASNWQRREIIAHATRGMREEEAAEAGAGALGEPEEDEYYDEEDDGDDDMDMEEEEFEVMRRVRGLASNAVGGQRSEGRVNRVRNGLMRIPLLEETGMKIPEQLFFALTKILLYADELPGENSPILNRTFQNMANQVKLSDKMLKLMCSLLSNERHLLGNVLSEMSGGESDWQAIACSADAAEAIKANSVAKPVFANTRAGTRVESGEGKLEVSASAARRILALLTHLAYHSPLHVYLMLESRTEADLNVEEEKLEVLKLSLKDTSKSGADAVKAGAEEEAVTKTPAEEAVDSPLTSSEKTATKTGAGKICGDFVGSTNSLLEALVQCYSIPSLQSSATDMHALSYLIDVVTSPLEYLVDESGVEGSPKTVVVTDGMKAKDLKQRMVSRPVPHVVMQRESLASLCDVLLNDLCTRRIFLLVTSAISRLAKIQSNSSVLVQLIHDVVVDMSEHSQVKLEGLEGKLLTTATAYYKSQQQAVFSSGEKGNPEPMKLEGDATTTSAQWAVNSNTSKKIPCSMLPLGESGGKQHERLLRVVQTLASIALKTNRALLDVTPVEQLSHLWKRLESVLQLLRNYLVDAEEEEAEEKDQLETIRPQTTLTSLLNRLLPAIEAFLLVHASDLLSEKACEAAIAAVGGTTDSPEAKTNGLSVAATVPAGRTPATGNTEVASARAAMPGESYRKNAAYIRNNLSLFPETEDGLGGRQSSFRKQSSFNMSGLSRQLSATRGSSGPHSSHKGYRLMSFVQTHKGVLNLLVKSKPSLLESSFACLVRITQLRPMLMFDNKRKYFFSQLKRRNQRGSRRAVHLQIRRNQVFEDTFHQLRVRTADELLGRLQVNFYGEEGVDAGGLSREWYMILSREIFNPNYALFTATADGATFQPNPLSMINTNHLDYFKFVGRVIGKAICDGQLMDAHFTRSFYKHVLGMPVDFSDIQATEPDYYKTLKQILDTPLDLLMMDMTFSAEIQKFGRTEVVDLIPNGRNIAVTDDNKYDYIRLIAHHRMTSAIKSQIDSFLNGFYDLVPPELISIFSPAELELLICGLPDVNIEELKVNTEYHQYKTTDEVIQWMWEALESFNREERASFLQFVTGTSKVPLGGFANLQGMRGTQRFSVHKAYGGVGQLPTAHTCFNQLDLPAYTSAEELREKLLMAINEGSEGFGFA